MITAPLFAEAAEHHGPDMNSLIASVVNFIILIGILVYYGRKPIKEMLKSRKESIETEVNKSKIEKERVEAELTVVNEKISGMDDEIIAFKELSKNNLENRKELLIKTNNSTIENLNKNLEAQELNAVESLKIELQKEMTQKAIIIAEEKIKELLARDKMAEVKLLKQFKIS